MTVVVKCVSCGTKNRVDEKNMHVKNAVCGNCNAILPVPRSAKQVELTDNNFDNYISSSQKPVLVDFWAEWCAPCKYMIPILEEFAAHHPSITVGKVNVESNHMIGFKFNITNIPTLILFVNGKEVKRIFGAQTLAALESELEPWITIN